MKENGLNPDKYYKPDGKRSNSSSRSGSGSGTEGCYLAAACVAAKGLPDSCEELQTLRSFRDGYLASQPDGQMEIEQYYAIAPKIVAAVNQRPDAAEIWNRIYEELVLPCVQMIHANQNAEVHRLYREYSLKLSSQYLNIWNI